MKPCGVCSCTPSPAKLVPSPYKQGESAVRTKTPQGLLSPHSSLICSSVLLSNTKFCVILCLRLPSIKKSKKVRFLTRLGGIWISRKYVVYLYREKEILPQRGYLLHFCPIFWVKKGKITRHMRKNMCRII